MSTSGYKLDAASPIPGQAASLQAHSVKSGLVVIDTITSALATIHSHRTGAGVSGSMSEAEVIAAVSAVPDLDERERSTLMVNLRRQEGLTDKVELRLDVIPLNERNVKEGGLIEVKLIAPGWGSSGYYSAEMLERDGPSVFREGLHMYLDHPGSLESADRPERTVRDLAAVLIEDVQFRSDDAEGPGLFAKAKVFESFRTTIKELAPHIGVSIRAFGHAEHGEAEGKEGDIVTSIVEAVSVDFVTAAGAGGRILEILEAKRTQKEDGVDDKELMEVRTAREAAEARVKVLEEEQTTDRGRITEMEEAQKGRDTEMARLQEASLLREAREAATVVLAKVEALPDPTRKRLCEQLAQNPPTTDDGKLDKGAFDKAIEEAIKSEVAYLAEVTGSGNILGLGNTGDGDNEKAITESLEDSFARMGLSEGGAKVAAGGHIN